MNEYPPPVDQLLRLGEPEDRIEWRDYRALGLGPEHVPDLIRLATDVDLVMASDLEAGQDDPAVDALGWAPQHALRALGQLGAVEAIDPLFEAVGRFRELHDFWIGDFDDVMGHLGAAAIPACERHIADASLDEYERMVAAESLEQIARRHPELRDRCVAALTTELGNHESLTPGLAGLIVGSLVQLKAVEAAPVIEAAYAADRVERFFAGTWEDVRYELGLGPMPESRRRPQRRLANPFRPAPAPPGRSRPSLDKLKKQQKKRRKKGR